MDVSFFLVTRLLWQVIIPIFDIRVFLSHWFEVLASLSKSKSVYDVIGLIVAFCRWEWRKDNGTDKNSWQVLYEFVVFRLYRKRKDICYVRPFGCITSTSNAFCNKNLLTTQYFMQRQSSFLETSLMHTCRLSFSVNNNVLNEPDFFTMTFSFFGGYTSVLRDPGT